MKMNEVCAKLTIGIKGYFEQHNFSKAVLGLSGGIDSSATAFLAAKALGSENVTGILMPEEGLTSGRSINDAMEVVNILRIHHYKIPINNFISNFHSINKNQSIKSNIINNFNIKKARYTRFCSDECHLAVIIKNQGAL